MFVFIPRINSYDKKEIVIPNGLWWSLLPRFFCFFLLGISYLAEFLVLVFERRWIILADNQIYIKWSRALQPKEHTYYANRLKLSLIFGLFLHFDWFKIRTLISKLFLILSFNSKGEFLSESSTDRLRGSLTYVVTRGRKSNTPAIKKTPYCRDFENITK